MTSKVGKFFSRLITKTIWLLSIVFILLVLVLSVIKISLPYWLKQKETIISQLESSIGGEFNYASLQVDWSDFHPKVSVRDLTWKSPDDTAFIKVVDSKVEVDIWKTLYLGSLATKEVEIQGIGFSIDSQTFATTETSLERTIKIIANKINNFDHQYILLKDMSVNFNANKDKKQNFSQVIFKQQKDKKQLLLDSTGDYIEKARLVIETKGAVLTDEGLVDYFVDFSGINLELLAVHLKNEQISEYKSLAVKFWGKQRNRLLEKSRLELQNEASEQAKVNLKVNLAHENGLYKINSEQFVTSLKNDNQWVTHDSYIDLQSRRAGKNLEYQLNTGVVPVAFMKNISLLLSDEDIKAKLQGLDPKGVIDSSKLTFVINDNALIPKDGVASISNFSVEAFEGIPGIQLDKLDINGIDGNWSLEASLQSGHFDWRPNFKALIPIESLTLKASYNASQFKTINVDELLLSNSDSTIKARASLNFADDFSMAIYAEAEDVVIANLHSYWPRNGSFTPKTLQYLDTSLLGGKVPFAKLIWQGEVEQFPFKNKEGVFDIQAQVSKARFKFEEDWPVASNISGNASFENEKMTIVTHQGELLGAQVSNAKAILPDLKAPDEQLLINIDANTDVNSYKKIYQQSPLKGLLGDDLLELGFDKLVKVKLSLDMLLAKEVELKLDGLATFDGNNITGIPYGIELTNTKGELKFTHNGAIAENLNATYLGQPFAIDIKVDEFTEDGSTVQIDAIGKVNLSDVSNSILGFVPIQVDGTSEINTHYKLYDESTRSESLIIRSDLIDSTVKGPSWIAKDKGASAPLLVALQNVEDKVEIRSSYKDTLSAQLYFDANKSFNPRGLIKLGSVATQNIEVPQQGVAIEGYFDNVVLHEWLDTFSFPQSLQSETKASKVPSWIERINLTTPELEFAGQRFTKVRINDVKEKDSEELYRFNLFSEQARANISQKANGQKHLTIEHLDISLNKDARSKSNPVDIALDEYDNWLFECINCKVNSYHFGPITLASNYQNDVIKIEGQGTAGGFLNAGVTGTIDNKQTNIALDFNIERPQKLLEYWDIDGGVRDTKTSGNINLIWPGRVHDFELNQLDGEFNIKAGKGSIKDLSDRKARIFSLFSLQSIPRRLSLDFSDIFSDGFFYDEIIGNFNIAQGVLIAEKAEIKGTAADVSISGSVDLNNQTVEQQVIVTPKLGSSLPVLAGWAIEPTTGLIMLIVSKIFEPALNVVSQIEYKISGALDDPEVIEVSKKSKEVQVTEEQIEAQKKLEEQEEGTEMPEKEANL